MTDYLKGIFIGDLRLACRVGNPRSAQGMTERDFEGLVQKLEYALLEATRNGERRVQNAIREALDLPPKEEP